ncbi:hypothetical protein SAY87_021376 [Trapa incisa]|uniref:Uncharacterized protein n=1 Tax=Trapa incisa TaxID=236973 RepID=A0AAN7JS04_9MYRT|nr:hypothetical protein SAY87_021376 [Trapa incisa]
MGALTFALPCPLEQSVGNGKRPRDLVRSGFWGQEVLHAWDLHAEVMDRPLPCIFLPLYVFTAPLMKLLGQPDDVAQLSGVVARWMIPLHFSYAFQCPLTKFLQCQMENNVTV